MVDLSSVYETDAIGGPDNNPQFLNLVMVAETTLEPRTLLERAMAIEDAFGRERPASSGPAHAGRRPHRGGTTTRDKPDLRLPHPLAHQRGFVLVPWSEVDPTRGDPRARSDGRAGRPVDLSGVVRRNDLSIDTN